jgi:hypothetical protein
MSSVETARTPPARWRSVGSFLVLYTVANVAIPDALWDQVLSVIDSDVHRGVLSLTGGDGLVKITRPQWRKSAAIIGRRGYPVAAITDHTVTLELTRAASWLGSNARGFRWRELEAGFEFLGVPTSERPAMREAIEQLREGVLPLAGALDWPRGFG